MTAVLLVKHISDDTEMILLIYFLQRLPCTVADVCCVIRAVLESKEIASLDLRSTAVGNIQYCVFFVPTNSSQSVCAVYHIVDDSLMKKHVLTAQPLCNTCPTNHWPITAHVIH